MGAESFFPSAVGMTNLKFAVMNEIKSGVNFK